MDYVVYNNADTVGVLNKEVELSVFTNKPAPDAMGDRVWLLFGQGNPRRYFLRLWFQIDKVEDGSEHGFKTRLSGSVGNSFDPMIEVTNEEWFKDLKREQGSFAFGFNSIKNPVIVECLLRLVSTESTKPAVSVSESVGGGGNGPDLVVYNNSDTVGSLAKEIPLSVFTNKRADDAVGGRVWLFFGSGRPRRYFLSLWFEVNKVEDGSEHGFRTRLSGVVGRKFEPMLDVTHEEWFKRLKREQGNFAFGCNSIKDQTIVYELIDLVSAHAGN